MSDFYCIPTNIGLTKLAAFATGGSPITIVEFAVGDANGVPYLPETRVAHNTLVHECYRNAIESVLVSPFDAHVSIATINLAANVGGWRVCEIALIDDDGDIIYLANYPNNYKPTLSEGAGGELEIPVYLQASAVGSIAVVVDPNIIRASQDWVNLNFATKIELQAEVDNRSDAFVALMTRLTANGIDANLATTNNATGLNLDDAQFRVAGTWYFDHAINASMEDTAGIMTARKAGNKVYQHEILETGREGNRVFNGTIWLPWVFQTVGTPPPNTVPLVPISSYADLNNFNSAGNFSFSSSDNIVHAPPTQGSEADYELQVLVTPNSGIVQIVKNVTTNTGFVRVKEGGFWQNEWVLTAPIEHIITNANVDGIRSEGVYLCTKDTNTGLPATIGQAVFILYVKNSATLQTVVQVVKKVAGNYSSGNGFILHRSLIDSGLSGSSFGNWDEDIYSCLSVNNISRVNGYINSIHPYNSSVYNSDHYVDFILRNYNINNIVDYGVYVFTLNDNIENIPADLTDENNFCFLFFFENIRGFESTIDGWHDLPSDVVQVILQYHHDQSVSNMFIRLQPKTDFLNGLPFPEWTFIP